MRVEHEIDCLSPDHFAFCNATVEMQKVIQGYQRWYDSRSLQNRKAVAWRPAETSRP